MDFFTNMFISMDRNNDRRLFSYKYCQLIEAKNNLHFFKSSSWGVGLTYRLRLLSKMRTATEGGT